jgi:hypothetical protein
LSVYPFTLFVKFFQKAFFRSIYLVQDFDCIDQKLCIFFLNFIDYIDYEEYQYNFEQAYIVRGEKRICCQETATAAPNRSSVATGSAKSAKAKKSTALMAQPI